MRRALLVFFCVFTLAFRAFAVENYWLHNDTDYAYYPAEDGSARIQMCFLNPETLIVPSVIDGRQVTGINEYGLSYLHNLKSITLPEGLTHLDKDALSSCSVLTDVSLPESLTFIGDGAFSKCDRLASITLPAGVQEIGVNPFYSCPSLTDIAISQDSEYLMTIDGVLFSRPDMRLVSYPSGKPSGSYTVPDGVRVIGEKAFYDAVSLTETSPCRQA